MSTEEKPRRLSPHLRRLSILKLWLIEKFRFGERQVTLVWAAVIGVLGAEVDLADLIKHDPLTLPQNATFSQIAQTFVQHQFQHIYIVDGQRKLLGAVSLHQVKAFLDRPELETLVIAESFFGGRTFAALSCWVRP
jgi:hypothetical protein